MFSVRRLDVEHPVHDHPVAIDREGRARPRRDRLHAPQHLLLARHERLAPGADVAEVLLHGGVFGVEFADRPDVVAGFHHRDKGLHPLARWHGDP